MQTEPQQAPKEKPTYLFDSNKCGKWMKISSEKLNCTNTTGIGLPTVQTSTGFDMKGTSSVHFQVHGTDKNGNVVGIIGIGQQMSNYDKDLFDDE